MAGQVVVEITQMAQEVEHRVKDTQEAMGELVRVVQVLATHTLMAVVVARVLWV